MDIDKRDKSDCEKVATISIGADLIMSVWIIVVAISYFGGLFYSGQYRLPAVLSAVYAVMLTLSVVSIARRYLKNAPSSGGGSQTKQRPPRR